LPGLTEICILGPRELTEPFRAVGLGEARADESSVLEKARELALSNYKIVFYAEEFYPLLREFLLKRKGRMFPTFVPIPSMGEEERYAIQRVRELIKKAIGVDVYLEAE
jgi:vacuolar-type H+-ATPase subunit F/Vma7